IWLKNFRISSRERFKSIGFTGASPRSATRQVSYGETLVTEGTRLIKGDISRTCRGPWRGPGRFVVPPSQGTPTMAISTSRGSVKTGRRMNVECPANRGVTPESTGSKRRVVMVVAPPHFLHSDKVRSAESSPRAGLFFLPHQKNHKRPSVKYPRKISGSLP